MSGFYLQVFATNPSTLMFARALAGFSVGIHPGALIAYVHYQKQSLGKFISLGSLGWMVGFLLAGVIGGKNGSLFWTFISFLRLMFLAGFQVKRH